MAHGYRMVTWTPYKKAFDLWMAAGIFAFLAAFVAASILGAPQGQRFSEMQILIRAFGAAAFGLLTLILCIGPASRLSPRFLPLLYNRRHLGVACFFLALAHAGLTLLWYQGFSDLNPLISLLVSNPRYASFGGFPFESLGLAALLILFLMAATSHDFWNRNLGPRVWKGLHMAVYAAYGLLVAHVLLGAVQTEKALVYPIALAAAATLVAGLHLVAGFKESAMDRPARLEAEGWIKVGPALDIPDRRARVITPPQGEKIAVFRDGDRIFGLSHVCRHQGGPLGEGRIIDGCVTCPWHGFQYLPENGRSPPPYDERIPTYRTRLVDGVVYVHPAASAPGVETPPARIKAPE